MTVKNQEIVLIVEDDPETAKALAEYLNSQGYRSMIATNGQEAIDVLRAGERPCLILLDIMMPVKNGWDFRAEMLSEPELAAIPIVVVTADIAAVSRAMGLRLPLLRKPIDPRRLMSEVARHC
jgi:CheY-like chemotaxis protein